MNLTPRQKQVYDFIAGYVGDRGHAPTLREIAAGCGFKSHARVCTVLKDIEKRGHIKVVRYQPNGIILTDPSAPGPGQPTFDMVKAGRTAMLEFTVGDFRDRPEVIAIRVYQKMREAM